MVSPMNENDGFETVDLNNSPVFFDGQRMQINVEDPKNGSITLYDIEILHAESATYMFNYGAPIGQMAQKEAVKVHAKTVLKEEKPTTNKPFWNIPSVQGLVIQSQQDEELDPIELPSRLEVDRAVLTEAVQKCAKGQPFVRVEDVLKAIREA